jgi:hypothetical protein
MGRPLKIQKYSTGSGNAGAAVAVDQAYPPFTAPSSLDLNTVVLPTPTTTSLWMGVVGGQRGGAVSATYPVVEVQVNIALPSGAGFGAHNGVIIRQKGSHKFLVADLTSITAGSFVVGAAYQIRTYGTTTDWQSAGAPVTAQVGDIFTATSVGGGNGTVYLVGQCVLKKQAIGSLTVGNMSITMSIGDSAATFISKLSNKYAKDFNGGEVGGNANTGNVWNPDQVVNDITYAANFFEDGEQFVKSGADLPTWAASNGSDQNSDGTLTTALVENYTS